MMMMMMWWLGTVCFRINGGSLSSLGSLFAVVRVYRYTEFYIRSSELHSGVYVEIIYLLNQNF